MAPLKPWVWTLIGGLSIPLWATWPALSLQMQGTPPLECLTIGFAVGWVVLARLEKGSQAALLIGVERLSFSYVGVILAFLAGVSWASYCLFRLRWKGETGPILARGFGIAASLCGVLHLMLEHSGVPSIGSAGAAVLVGIASARGTVVPRACDGQCGDFSARAVTVKDPSSDRR